MSLNTRSKRILMKIGAAKISFAFYWDLTEEDIDWDYLIDFKNWKVNNCTKQFLQSEYLYRIKTLDEALSNIKNCGPKTTDNIMQEAWKQAWRRIT